MFAASDPAGIGTKEAPGLWLSFAGEQASGFCHIPGQSESRLLQHPSAAQQGVEVEGVRGGCSVAGHH